MRQKIAAGNWKMNGTRASLPELFAIAGDQHENAEVIICPPFSLLHEALTGVQGTHCKIGAQNCFADPSGAFTGEVSADMVADIGATHVILGHSERRELFGESSELVANKARAAHAAHLVAIICVGETLDDRRAGRAEEIVQEQLHYSLPEGCNGENTIIAYEPVWAIGTGEVPTNEEIAQMHAHIRKLIPDAENMRVLYGGSVKPSNALEIFSIENVDGGLVGGASLKAKDFLPIIDAAAKAS